MHQRRVSYVVNSVPMLLQVRNQGVPWTHVLKDKNTLGESQKLLRSRQPVVHSVQHALYNHYHEATFPNG